MNISNFSRQSTLKTTYLWKSKVRIYVDDNSITPRLSYLCKPKIKRVKSIFDKERKKSKFDMRCAEKFVKLLDKPSKQSCEFKKCIDELISKRYTKLPTNNCCYSKHVRKTKCDKHEINTSKILPLNNRFDDFNKHASTNDENRKNLTKENSTQTDERSIKKVSFSKVAKKRNQKSSSHQKRTLDVSNSQRKESTEKTSLLIDKVKDDNKVKDDDDVRIVPSSIEDKKAIVEDKIHHDSDEEEILISSDIFGDINDENVESKLDNSTNEIHTEKSNISIQEVFDSMEIDLLRNYDSIDIHQSKKVVEDFTDSNDNSDKIIENTTLKLLHCALSSNQLQSVFFNINQNDTVEKNCKMNYSNLNDGNLSINQYSHESFKIVAVRGVDRYFDKRNDNLIQVTKLGFTKIYNVRKLENKESLKYFCKDPISRKSKLYQIKSRINSEVEITRLSIKDLKKYCGEDYVSELNENDDQYEYLTDVKREHFTVKCLNDGKYDVMESNIKLNIDVMENPMNSSNFTVFKTP